MLGSSGPKGREHPIGDKQENSTCLFIFVSNQKLCTFEELHQDFKGILYEKGRMTWIYGNMDIWIYGNMDICKEFNRKMDLPYIRQLLNEESRERSYKRSICLHI